MCVQNVIFFILQVACTVSLQLKFFGAWHGPHVSYCVLTAVYAAKRCLVMCIYIFFCGCTIALCYVCKKETKHKSRFRIVLIIKIFRMVMLYWA